MEFRPGMLIDETETKSQFTVNPLDQFVLMAKGTKGAACQDLIKTVLEAPGVYVFSELLAHPNVCELENTPYANYLNTLNIFAFGTYKNYLENQNELIELTDAMKKKLRHLTIVTMAISNKCIAYSDLQEQLDIGGVRELEDLIIESIYADIIHGKLDHKNKQLEVDYTIGRDIRSEDLKKISATLHEWCVSCESVLQTIENQIDQANSAKAVSTKHTEDLEAEIVNVKENVKDLLIDIDEDYNMDYKDSMTSSNANDSRIRKNKCRNLKRSRNSID